MNDVLGMTTATLCSGKAAKRLREGLPPDTYIARLSGILFAVVGPVPQYIAIPCRPASDTPL